VCARLSRPLAYPIIFALSPDLPLHPLLSASTTFCHEKE
jgi:hypothetical protein